MISMYDLINGGLNMSITGLVFLFVFLPVSLALYYMVNDHVKDYVLLAFSLLFYALGSVKYLTLFIVATTFTVLIGRMVNSVENKLSKKLLLILGVVVNAGLLVYFKFADFIPIGKDGLSLDARNSILLPLGISFFTFKAISYLADVYKEEIELTENPVHDALYLSFFAHIQAGPIVRYKDFALKEDHGRIFSVDSFSNGVFRFLVGFSKKVLIANTLSKIVDEVYSTQGVDFSTSLVWLGSICFSLELLFDFSGYSDMAIGISEMFGYSCSENFNYPYMTPSVSKFWRRWHISLSSWFKDYIYIPLGGSRNKNRLRVYFNLFIVWLLTGIWHGNTLNFIVWGLLYFVAISFERLTGWPDKFKSKITKGIYRVLTLVFINIEWIFFKAPSLSIALFLIKRLLICPKNSLADKRALFLLKDNLLFIVLAIVLCFPLVPYLDKKLEYKKALHIVFEIIVGLLVVAGFIFSLSFIVAGQNNPFAYINF